MNRFGTRNPHEYRPAGIPDDILPMCFALHCHNTGSSDPMSDEDVSLYMDSLEWVVENWRPSDSMKHKVAEDAIRNLCRVIIGETLVCKERTT